MASLLERLQEALRPEYDVRHELATGGMGIVYLARHLGLDRRVAIKVLAPELASAAAAQRFMREARILASLSHSHVVPIHHVGEADGLFYYVMDYIDGETLADALRRGPMSVEEVVKLGRDLLDALEAVHDRGVVHRDIKPANIFLSGKRALLGDFGIAKQDSGSDQTLTQAGAVIGTPSYMPPEQTSGETVTERTDIYAVALVLYEALTGRQWRVVPDPHDAPWAGVPIGVARVLRGALAFVPADRWPNATTFRHKLWGTRVRRYQWRTAALTAAGIVVGGALVWVILTLLTPSPVPGALVVRVEPFQRVGADPLRLTESITAFVVRSLGGSTDFQVCEPNRSCKNATVTLHGTVTVSGSLLSVTVQTEDLFGLRPQRYASWEGPTSQRRAGADAVAFDVLYTLWSQSSPLAKWLPLGALPQGNTSGFNRFIAAERLFSEARWAEARDAYAAAAEGESGCWLCSWRIGEIDRQHPGAGVDAVHMQRVLDNRELFPPPYQPLIGFETLEATNERLDILRTAAAQWPHFYYLHYRLGEELFNRGPLVGQPRSEAILHLAEALARRPGFAPALVHLAWAAIAEGDQEIAERALDDLEDLPTPTDPASLAYGLVIPIGFAYRFLGGDAGNDEAESALGIEGIDLLPQAAAGARLMPGFDAPNGAIDFGRMFEAEAQGRVHWRLAGLMGQMFGYLAMGRLDSARVHVREIDGLGQLGDDFRLFAAQLEAFLMLFDEEAAGLDRNDVVDRLQRFVHEDAASSLGLRRRAAWTLSLLYRQAGADSAADSMTELAGSQSDPLAILLDAHRSAADDDFADALRRADPLKQWQRARSVSEALVGPFFRTVLHLLRAEWEAERSNFLAARGELLWHQGYDQAGLPLREPRVEEVDWAFGTLARWRRAEVIEQIASDDPELCHIYDDIVRLWSEGDAVHAARAETARRKLGELNCEAITR